MGGLDHLAVRTWLFASRHTCMPPEGDCHAWVVGLRPHVTPPSGHSPTPKLCPLYPPKADMCGATIVAFSKTLATRPSRVARESKLLRLRTSTSISAVASTDSDRFTPVQPKKSPGDKRPRHYACRFCRSCNCEPPADDE
jgi:hypothetical protein